MYTEKNIDLCGFGNGLMDILINVDFEDLEKLDIKKGSMILIDNDTRERVLNYFKDRKLNYCSGGSAANTIIAFSKLGGRAAYNTVVGKDEIGDYYANEFKELNIILNAKVVEDYPTGTCVVFITPDSERTLYTNLAATALFDQDNIQEEIISASKWIYIEGYKFSEESSTKAIFKAVELSKKHNTKISLTFSDNFITEQHYENLYNTVKHSDLVFCNEPEVLSFTKTYNKETAKQKLSEIVPNFAITLGANGSIIKWDGNEYQIPAYQTTAIDTTGAGDIYAGAFLYGIIKDNNPVIAGHLAALAASKIVSQIGPRPNFDLIELYEFVKKNLKL